MKAQALSIKEMKNKMLSINNNLNFDLFLKQHCWMDSKGFEYKEKVV